MGIPMDRQLTRLRPSPTLLRRVAELDEFKGRWQALRNLTPDRLSSLQRIATVESVASSTRIEGVTLTDDQVHHLLRNVATAALQTRDEQEVAGYAAVMDLVFESFPAMSLTENHILQLHSVLLSRCLADSSHRGAYKRLPNSIEAIDASGRSLGILLVTTPPHETPGEMQALLAATRAALAADAHHPLLVIALFVVRFLAIHPFQDGNGRLSRVLTTLLLLRAGYDHVRFASLERVIEHNKDAYYELLRRAQVTWSNDEPQLEDWVTFFVQCLVEQKNVLQHRLEREQTLAPQAPLAAAILALVRERGRVTVRDVVALHGANRNTVKLHLKQLVAGGQLVLRGQARGAWYELR
jgi:Fic family protein